MIGVIVMKANGRITSLLHNSLHLALLLQHFLPSLGLLAEPIDVREHDELITHRLHPIVQR